MRKTTIALIAMLLIGAGVAGALFLPKFLGASALVKELSLAFMEDLQFKDFRRSSLYHHDLERDRVDIGRSIERLFLLKPEFLDLREFHIVKAEVDSTGDRARVHIRTKYKKLNLKKEPEEGEVILYWIKRDPGCPIGGTCSADGKCLDESKAPMLKPVDDKKRSKDDRVKRDDPLPEQTEEPYTCQPGAEPQWFMNLDSTLKEKHYNI